MSNSYGTYRTARTLPIYTAAYKLLMGIDTMFDFYKRDRRHTVGQWIYMQALNIIKQIRFANDDPSNREQHILDLLGSYDEVATLLKLSQEKGYIPQDKYVSLIKPLGDLEKQAVGWLTSTRKARVEGEKPVESVS